MEDMEELEDRLDILRGDKPRNKKAVVEEDSENTLITLPLKDVEEMRLKLRNLEEIITDLTHALNGVGELKMKYQNLEDANKELMQILKETKDMKGNKKNKEQTRE
jgi:hypothetical protein